MINGWILFHIKPLHSKHPKDLIFICKSDLTSQFGRSRWWKYQNYSKIHLHFYRPTKSYNFFYTFKKFKCCNGSKETQFKLLHLKHLMYLLWFFKYDLTKNMVRPIFFDKLRLQKIIGSFTFFKVMVIMKILIVVSTLMIPVHMYFNTTVVSIIFAIELYYDLQIFVLFMVNKCSAIWLRILLLRVLLGSWANEDSISRIDCEPQKWTYPLLHMYPLSPLPPALVPWCAGPGSLGSFSGP